MYEIIDLKSELLVDRSRVKSPHVRLLLAVIGEPVVQGSPWVAVDKQIACRWNVLNELTIPRKPVAA